MVRVVATAAAATIPFGSVSHLLPGGTAPAIAEFVAVLRGGDLGPAPTLFVDDAHLLDDASAALLLAIANTGVAPLLLTVRSHEPVPDALVALWKDRYLDRVDLQSLSEREVEQMVDDLLGAPSHALAYKWIYRVSQGNPLFVTEIIADVRRTGRLELRDGRWHLDEGRKPFERLSELLASHIGSVSAEAHAALEVLALGTPMRLSVFEELASADALEELERAMLAVVSHDGRGTVRRGRPSALRRSGAREPACVGGPAHPARPRPRARRSRGRHTARASCGSPVDARVGPGRRGPVPRSQRDRAPSRCAGPRRQPRGGSAPVVVRCALPGAGAGRRRPVRRCGSGTGAVRG